MSWNSDDMFEINFVNPKTFYFRRKTLEFSRPFFMVNAPPYAQGQPFFVFLLD
jgi:hypothetical protein